MPEKLSIIILKVDLQCSACTKKIKKTLCKLQDRERIRTLNYDEKNNFVTISGPFDSKKLIKKICCKACKVIKDIKIVEEKFKSLEPEPEPEPDPPAPDPEPEPEPKKPDPEKQSDDPEPRQRKPVSRPPEPAYPYPKPLWTLGSGCCCRPWIKAYYGGCRCCSCGWIGFYGPVNCGPPPVVYDYRAPPYEYRGPCYGGPNTCEFIWEEQSSTCGIM